MRSISADVPQHPTASGALSSAERWARYAPAAIICYFALQLAVRLCLSSNLEVDDAEMVGQTYWAWGYPNSHAPLYHWLVRLCYDVLGSWPAATAVPKFALLAGGYLLVYDAARRASGSRLTAAVAAASLLFVPVLAWKAQGKLTHSILGFAATAATLHAVVLVVMRGRIAAFVWLGCAVAAGVLSKYNYLLVLGALVLSCAVVAPVRAAFLRRATLVSMLIPMIVAAPHVFWVRQNAAAATERLYMMQTGGRILGITVPAASVVDGLMSLALVVLVSVAPILAIYGLAIVCSTRNGGTHAGAVPFEANGAMRVFRRLFGVVLLAELVALVAVVLIGRFSQVHERYLVVMLPPLGLWIAMAFACAARPRAARFVLCTAVTCAALLSIARPLSIAAGNGRLMFPYAAFAADIQASFHPPFAIVADRPDNAANIALRLPDAKILRAGARPPRVLVVSDTPAAIAGLAGRLGSSYVPDGELKVIAHPRPFAPGERAELAVQMWHSIE